VRLAPSYEAGFCNFFYAATFACDWDDRDAHVARLRGIMQVRACCSVSSRACARAHLQRISDLPRAEMQHRGLGVRWTTTFLRAPWQRAPWQRAGLTGRHPMCCRGT